MHMNPDTDLTPMLADGLADGLLENVLALLRQEPHQAPLLAGLVADERVRVRIGAVAAVEALQEEANGGLTALADALVPHLTSDGATLRGDAAYLLGLVGEERHLDRLTPLLNDPHPDVVVLVEEAVAAIRARAAA
jgi:HEAT repeat protein